MKETLRLRVHQNDAVVSINDGHAAGQRIEDALQRSPWCLLVPAGSDEPDVIGPFTSYEEVEIWSQIYPDAGIRKMVSRELEILHRRESEEIEAWKRPHN